MTSSSGSIRKERVAIIFNGDDSDKNSLLSKSFLDEQLQAIKLYREAKFDRVIVLTSEKGPNGSATAQNFRNVVENLKGVSEIHMQFMAHGSLIPMSNPTPANMRFPSIPLSLQESKLYSASKSKTGVYQRAQFLFGTTAVAADPKERPHVGLGDIDQALDRLKRQNPDLKAVIYSGACYSGSVARYFANTPGVQTFSSSQANLTTWAILQQESDMRYYKAFDSFFQKHLLAGQTYLNAYGQSMDDYLSIAKQSGTDANPSEAQHSLPRSGLYEFMLNWCIEKNNPSPGSNECRNKRWLTPIKKDFERYDKYLLSHPEQITCNQSATAILKINEKKKAILKNAIVFVEEKLNTSQLNFDQLLARTEQLRKDKVLSAAAAGFLQKNRAQRLANELNLWSSAGWSASTDQRDKYIKDCWGDPKKGVDAELNKIYCLEEKSKENPVLALELASDVNFGKACPVYKMLVESVRDDKACYEKFSKFADCQDWSRLKELYDMGQGRLVYKGTPHNGENDNLKNGEATK